MKYPTTLKYALVLPLAAAVPAMAEPVDSADAVISALNGAGYAEVRDVEQDDGLWEAEVRGADGRFRDLHIVSATGEILDPDGDRTVLTADEVRSRLEAEGFKNVKDLDLDEAVWEAEADAADGSRVDLVINGFDGSVIESENDD
jgi:uncharacterized membrane protein YkoI